MTRVYRIQDGDGRGPWRPGFSRHWTDKEFGPGVENLPPWDAEFGADLVERRGLPGEHYGCAVRKPRELRRWVSDAECHRLAALGFNVVSVKADRILAESKNQIVFASRVPLARAAIVLPWASLT